MISNRTKKNIQPSVKLIFILTLVIGILSLYNIKLLLLCFILVFSYLVIIKIPIKLIIRRIILVLPFIGLMLIITPFQIPGRELFKINFGAYKLAASYEGVIIVGSIFIKAITSILLVLSLTETTPKQDIFNGMNQIYIPKIIIKIIELTFNYFVIILEEFKRVIRAQRARGFKAGKSILNIYTLKTIGYTIGHIFIRSLDRSERIYAAMVSRGYRYDNDERDRINLRVEDLFIIILGVIISISLIYIEKRWYLWL